MKIQKAVQTCSVLSLAFMAVVSHASDWSNELDLEYRYFTNDAQFEGQASQSRSVVYRPVWTHTSESGNSLFDFRGFARYDQDDEERTHLDINELAWTYIQGDWEVKSGIGKVYWGVAESQHLVDIVNQTDLVDSGTGDAKLGQPMVAVSRFTDVGEFSGYVLPYFRERTFAGTPGRLRPNPIVDTDAPAYESASEEKHVDYALRWAHTIGSVDVGLSYFDGTGRDPEFSINKAGTALTPNYVQIEQFGLDVQATLDSWLLKFEAINRNADEQYQNQKYHALVTGFEYSFYDVAHSGIDVGLVGEYAYDDRESLDDLKSVGFAAVRLGFNDEQSTDLLVGCTVTGNICALEGSRRLGDDFKLSISGNLYSGISSDSVLASQSEDDYLQVNLRYFF